MKLVRVPAVDLRERLRRLLRALSSPRALAMIAWVPAAFSSLYADALESADPGFRSAVSSGLWLVFAATLVVLLLPGALALTIARVVVAANPAMSLWALSEVAEIRPLAHGLALAVALAGSLAVLVPTFGEAVVDSAGYGNERRFLLRPPAAVVLVLIGPTWAVAVAGAVSGPLMLADGRWLTGGMATVVGVGISVRAVLALTRLARRWLVFVPNGVVVHDHLTVAQPTLLGRRDLASIGPAPRDSAAVDLTAAAFGLALEIKLRQAVLLSPVRGRSRLPEQSADAVLVTPSRPAAVLTSARSRGLPVA